MKKKLKEKAINLRKKGNTYSEILKIIPVAKSTLSDWLHSVGLSKKQKQRITAKKLEAIKRGGLARRNQRLKITNEIVTSAKDEIKNISERELWLIGSMLYWAEGAKEKTYRSGSGVIFSNSDPKMVKLFILWLNKCLKISDEKITFEIYIHRNYAEKINQVVKFWAYITEYSRSKFGKIYYKKHKLHSLRRNQGNNYHGLLRVRIKASTNINRKITGWIEGICQQCGVV
ncbi:hypothetical protein HY357_04845 [Candidatus Roizmanbacteria bacterium]|nr:hypothetical protein [Candidatus Roizmanbacteria bacterium]